MEYVVDIQCFKLKSNDFYVKELAILPIGLETFPTVITFKPTIHWRELSPDLKAENKWIQGNLLGLKWDDGDLPYHKIGEVLRNNLSRAKKIFMKGREKVLWLRKYVMNVVEIDADCPSLKVLRESCKKEILCKYHPQRSLNCAARNTKLLENFILLNQRSLDRSLKIFSDVKNLLLMEKEDIAYLPKSFIINFAGKSVDAAWEKIPEHYKIDHDLLLCLRCRKH